MLLLYRIALLVQAGGEGQLHEDAFALAIEITEPLTRVINSAKVQSGVVEIPAGFSEADFQIHDLVGWAPAAAASEAAQPAPASQDGDLLGMGAQGGPPPSAGPRTTAAAADASADNWALD